MNLESRIIPDSDASVVYIPQLFGLRPRLSVEWYSRVFAKNKFTSESRILGEGSRKISAGGGILGKDE